MSPRRPGQTPFRRLRSGEQSARRPDNSGIKSGDGTPRCYDEPEELREDRNRALAMFSLSSDTVARLDRFVDLLLMWQRRTNLIAPSTVSSLWTRHVADSLQLLDLVETPNAKPAVWLDLGSGGGFPGVVIACALADVPGTQVHLVESNLKKAAFLREAIRETKAPGIVHDTRIESLTPALEATVDYVTARALAPLADLLEMVAPFVKKGAKALLLKGQDLDHELTGSTKHWHIEAEIVPSRTSNAGRILIVRNLSQHAATLRASLLTQSKGGEAESEERRNRSIEPSGTMNEGE
jgi:16S rRNA (guanine527-N7)-methyltransferase